MRLNSSIALVAMAAVLAVPATAEAKAKKAHHAAKHVAKHEEGLTSSEELRMAQQQISQMQAQLNAMQAKLDQTASAQAETQTQVAQQGQAAQAADAKADKALVVADTAKATVAKTDKTVGAMKWAANTWIDGRMYFNFSDIEQNSNGTKNAASGVGFNVKRIYLGFNHKFNDVFSMNVTTDVSNVVGSTSNGNFSTLSSFGSPVGRGLYIKKAYMEAKIDPALIIRLGSADLPWIPYEENLYGYRHIENTITDGPFGTSADWGAHVLGKLGKHFDYQVSVINGGGYRNIKVTRSVDVEGRVGFNYDGIFAAVGGYVGKRGSSVEATPTYHTARRLDATAGFKNAQFTIGAQYFYAKDWNNVTTTYEDSADGYSIFGNYNVTPKWSVFGKYEWAQPYRIQNSGIRQHYFNVGLQWEPVKIVDLALVYKRDAVDNLNGVNACASLASATCNSYASTNGTFSATPGNHTTYDEVGLFGQVRF